MSRLEQIYAGGMLGYMLAVPIFQFIVSALIAVAVVKDSKAREYNNRGLWIFCAYVMPMSQGLHI